VWTEQSNLETLIRSIPHKSITNLRSRPIPTSLWFYSFFRCTSGPEPCPLWVWKNSHCLADSPHHQSIYRCYPHKWDPIYIYVIFSIQPPLPTLCLHTHQVAWSRNKATLLFPTTGGDRRNIEVFTTCTDSLTWLSLSASGAAESLNVVVSIFYTPRPCKTGRLRVSEEFQDASIQYEISPNLTWWSHHKI